MTLTIEPHRAGYREFTKPVKRKESLLENTFTTHNLSKYAMWREIIIGDLL